MPLRIHTAFGSSGVKSRLSPRPVCPVGANATFSQVRQQHKSPQDGPQEVFVVPPRKNYTKRDVLVFLRQSQARLVCFPLRGAWFGSRLLGSFVLCDRVLAV